MVTGMVQHVGAWDQHLDKVSPTLGSWGPHGQPSSGGAWGWSMVEGRAERRLLDSLLCAKSTWQRLQVQHMVLRISGTNEKA